MIRDICGVSLPPSMRWQSNTVFRLIFSLHPRTRKRLETGRHRLHN
jgi:hypothetical protein